MIPMNLPVLKMTTFPLYGASPTAASNPLPPSKSFEAAASISFVYHPYSSPDASYDSREKMYSFPFSSSMRYSPVNADGNFPLPITPSLT